MIVFMYRPSPQVPQPSLQAAQRCYDACVFNVKMHKQQVDMRSVDLTWIFTQSVFMALNTILWSLSYPGIRQEHPVEEVKHYLSIAMEVLAVSAQRWPGVESAVQLYKSLISGCLKAYDSEESFVIQSPSNYGSTGPSPAASNEVTSPPQSIPSPSSGTGASLAPSHASLVTERTISESVRQPRPSFSSEPTYPVVVNGSQYTYTSSQSAAANPAPGQNQAMPTVYSDFQAAQAPSMPQVPYQYATTSSEQTPVQNSVQPAGTFDPNSLYNSFPSVVPGLQHWDPNYETACTTSAHLTFPATAVDPMSYMGFIGDQYSQFFQEPVTNPTWRNRSLTQQEHVELMETLAQNVPDMPPPAHETTASYTCAMP
jgi:hypothetical protein